MDIVERLRAQYPAGGMIPSPLIIEEAAKEIERLRDAFTGAHQMAACKCACCQENIMQLSAGHTASGCWCANYPVKQRCDCRFCTEHLKWSPREQQKKAVNSVVAAFPNWQEPARRNSGFRKILTNESSLQFVAHQLHAEVTTVEQTLEWMKAHGQSVMLTWGEDNNCWECSWITSGARYTGVQQDMRKSILESLNKCFAAHAGEGN